MEKTYDPQQIEQRWYDIWEQQGYFKAQGSGQPYCIMIPPPNVTGTLHMGHGFQDSLMDTLIRYHRMKGDDTLWQVGTDHAGIATQMVVERQLAQQNLTRHDLGREQFVEKIWEWKHHSGHTISRQLRRMGASVDWDRERFTMDEGLSHAVHKVFIQLYEEGLIYRGKRLVNWDPKFHTAISDLEVISTEEKGFLWYIQYPLVDDPNQFVTVATTRPETLLGDTAVAVNPNDERFQHLIGKQLKLPLTQRTIPVIADDQVEPEFGTGCVKVTPAHDFNDYAIGKRHHLPMINVLTIDAKMNDQVPAAYQGLDRYVARDKIVADLKQLNLLQKIENHLLKVPRGDRSGEVIEPYLTDQWFVKADELAKPAIDVVKEGKIKFVPENWNKTYFQWMENIEDWCISRQLWWGHRIPAWYDEQGNIYVAHDEAEVRHKHQLNHDVVLTQDNDVLDTWFSSALWPFSTLGWPEKTPELAKFYPTSVLVTGFDIIFFWVARMIMMGLKFLGDVPFHEVYVTGLIRDHDGQKMSKSKGNVLDPLDLIDGISLDDLVAKRTQSLMQPQMAAKIENATRKEFPNGIDAYGTDALRFTYCILASTGRDIRFDVARLEGYRNFCNKIWNASRYVLMNTEGQDNGFDSPQQNILSIADKWILSLFNQTVHDVRRHLDNYRFDLASQIIYEFTWNEFCDWYLELSKPVLTGETSLAEKRGTRHTLLTVLEGLLKLVHPFMPFITEEIWQRVAPLTGNQDGTIMLQRYPEYSKALVNDQAEHEITWLKRVILGIRNIRGEMNISPKKELPVLLNRGNDNDRTLLTGHQQYLMTLAKLESINWLTDGEIAPMSATALAGDMEILIPLSGLIDMDAEKQRLQKELDKLQKDLLKAQDKLSNETFISKAPAAVVEKEKQLLNDLQNSVTTIEEKMAQLN